MLFQALAPGLYALLMQSCGALLMLEAPDCAGGARIMLTSYSTTAPLFHLSRSFSEIDWLAIHLGLMKGTSSLI